MFGYDAIVSFLVGWVDLFGYFGIFVLMFLESSFFPFPSEVIIIPAGYLAFQGKMNFFVVILVGVLGSICGAWLNYFLANRFGRKLVMRFLREHHLNQVERFFEDHGHISTFSGRLIPIVRQYISFPAGLARMNGWKFSLYTGLGAGIWVSILATFGYFFGQNEALVSGNLGILTGVVLGFVVFIGLIYFWRNRRK